MYFLSRIGKAIILISSFNSIVPLAVSWSLSPWGAIWEDLVLWYNDTSNIQYKCYGNTIRYRTCIEVSDLYVYIILVMRWHRLMILDCLWAAQGILSFYNYYNTMIMYNVQCEHIREFSYGGPWGRPCCWGEFAGVSGPVLARCEIQRFQA